jgi:subtilisin family serine protease
MGSQYVIFVDETLVRGSMQMAAVEAGFDLTRESTAQLPLGVELDLRRNVLGALAAALTGRVGAAVGAGAAAAEGAVVAMSDPAGQKIAGEEFEGTQILEGVSAIVVDEDMVDIASLAGVVGLTVLPNIEVRLPTPIVVEAVAPAADWHLRQIGLAPATAGGDDILIGVLDTGIDASHAEFAGKNLYFAEFDAAGRLISTVPRDAGEHGTHVCSTAAGARAGVAPDADLAVAAVLTNRDALGRMSGSLVQIVNGFNWLIATRFRDDKPGADVINASLGGGGFNPYLQFAVRTAFRLGVPLIAAIGNAGRFGVGMHGSPGNYPEVLGVGASDDQDVVAEFSDWGVAPPPTGPRYGVPALCAPGVQVTAAKPGGGFQAMSGTSMATPVVTGVAARRMSAKPALIGQPAALFTDLQLRLAPVTPFHLGNLGGAGRIMA